MTDYNKIYKKLSEKYSDEEIADAMLIPPQVSEIEAKKAREEFVKLRMKHRQEMSEKDRMLSGLLSIKYQIKSYIKSSDFDDTKRFSDFLQKYIDLLSRQQKQFADDISIHPSRLNRILKGKEKIGKTIAYRLEQHSGEIIPALFWWKLMQKEVENEIIMGKKERQLERKNVKNIAYNFSRY